MSPSVTSLSARHNNIMTDCQMLNLCYHWHKSAFCSLLCKPLWHTASKRRYVFAPRSCAAILFKQHRYNTDRMKVTGTFSDLGGSIRAVTRGGMVTACKGKLEKLNGIQFHFPRDVSLNCRLRPPSPVSVLEGQRRQMTNAAAVMALMRPILQDLCVNEAWRQWCPFDWCWQEFTDTQCP